MNNLKKNFCGVLLLVGTAHAMSERTFSELLDQKTAEAQQELAHRYQAAIQALIERSNRNALSQLWDNLTAPNIKTSHEKKTFASTNSHWADIRLADCGIGTLKDFRPDSKRYGALADPHVQFTLAENFLHEPALKNFNLAVILYQAAAEHGVAEAQAKVALYYRNKRDYKQNVFWLEKSAAQGWAPSLYNLGICYLQGLGVENKDPVKAADLFQEAADKGFAQAQYMLGKCYQNAWGVKKNIEQARYHYGQAAEQGFSPAQEALTK